MIARVSYTSPTNAEVLSESGHEASEEKGPHCVPHSAKGEEGQPVPEKAPGPPRCLLLIKYNAPLPSQPTGPAPLLGPLTALPSGEQLWPPPVCPPALAGKTISFCLSYP